MGVMLSAASQRSMVVADDEMSAGPDEIAVTSDSACLETCIKALVRLSSVHCVFSKAGVLARGTLQRYRSAVSTP